MTSKRTPGRRLIAKAGLGIFLFGALGWNGSVLAQALEKQKVSIAVSERVALISGR